jgi:trypsin
VELAPLSGADVAQRRVADDLLDTAAQVGHRHPGRDTAIARDSLAVCAFRGTVGARRDQKGLATVLRLRSGVLPRLRYWSWVVRGVAFLGVLALAVAAPSLTGPPAAEAIVGGSDASIGDFPYQVGIEITIFRMSGTESFTCGGSFRDSLHVITAAQCAVDDDPDYTTYPRILLPNEVKVGFGSSLPSTLTDAGPVTNVAVHPGYMRDSFASLRDDIAVLTLQNAVDFADPNAEAIAPALSAELATVVDATATGWGLTAEPTPGVPPAETDMLQKVALPQRPDSACESQYPGAEGYDASVMLCAGGLPSGAKDTCDGDGGGPLAIDVDPTSAVQWKLAGVTSFGDGCGRPGVPGAYTRLSSPEIQQLTGVAEPVDRPGTWPIFPGISITGEPRVGATAKCNPGSYPGAPGQYTGATPTRYLWWFIRDGGAVGLPPSPSSNLVLPPQSAGARVVCDVRFENAGGFNYFEMNADYALGPIAPAEQTPPPPPPDTTAPTSRIGQIRCVARRCRIRIQASDPGGQVSAINAKLTYKVKRCRRINGRKRCRNAKRTIRPRAILKNGSYQITIKLKRGRYTLTVIAIDTAGNRQTVPAKKTFRVK